MNGLERIPDAFLRACETSAMGAGVVGADGRVTWSEGKVDAALHAMRDLVGVGVSQGRQTVRMDLDSRYVGPGDVFVALKGRSTDGHAFIAQALARGASLVLCDPGYRPERLEVGDAAAGAVLLQVTELGRRLGTLAQIFHGQPARGLALVGVTGTNGKTTVATLVWSMLRGMGVPASLLGTAGGRLLDEPLPGSDATGRASLTTGDPIRLAEWMRAMREAGSTHLVMEVSSHALDQERVQGLSFDVAVFTNLSHDHLDYHGSMEAYGQAKRRLFLGLRPDAVAILNAQDPAWTTMAAGCGARIWLLEGDADGRHDGGVVGAEPERVWTLRQVGHEAGGMRFGLGERLAGGAGMGRERLTGTEPLDVRSPLMGRFNADNAALALLSVLALGFSADATVQSLGRASGAPGRLERVASDPRRAPLVLVDYAHTPDALQRVLRTAREMLATGLEEGHGAHYPKKETQEAATQGRVLVVFGCGGDRDRAKRAEMGAVAARWADVTVLTSDNPRSEDPEAILDEIEAGWRGAGSGAEGREAEGALRRIADRRDAIMAAVDEGAPGDIVLIAGKGHETSQVIGADVRPFDDREVAREALGGGDGRATKRTSTEEAPC